MAELTTLDEKIGEVLGLAMAAQGVTDKIKRLVEDEEIAQMLERTHEEAAQLEERCTALIEGFDGKKTAILEKARETKQEANEMMATYLGEEADGLDGFEFLTMAEAGEVGLWEILGAMNQKAGNQELQQVIEWAAPIQQRHFEQTLQGSVMLAAEENPNEPA